MAVQDRVSDDYYCILLTGAVIVKGAADVAADCAIADLKGRRGLKAFIGDGPAGCRRIATDGGVAHGEHSAQVSDSATSLASRITANLAIFHRHERRPTLVVEKSRNAAAAPKTRVVPDRATIHRQMPQPINQNAGNGSVGDRQVSNRDGLVPWHAGAPRVKDAAPNDGPLAINRELIRPKTSDGDAPINGQSVAHLDRTATQLGIEINRVAILSNRESQAKRTASAVFCVGDGEGVCVNALQAGDCRAKQRDECSKRPAE